jgi:nitrogen fixation protein
MLLLTESRRGRVTRRAVVLTGVGAFVGAALAADQTARREPAISAFQRDQLLPGQVLDLSGWKISLPTTPDPTQITMPRLAAFSDS